MKILLLFLISSVSGLRITCNFSSSYNWYLLGGVYTCSIASIDFSDNSNDVTSIGGLHKTGKSNVDVRMVYFENCTRYNLRSVPKNFANFFGNFVGIQLQSCGIQNLIGDELNQYKRLQWFLLSNSNVTRIPGNFFANNLDMRYIKFANNPIQEIGAGLLDNLRNLTSVTLTGNSCINLSADSQTQVANLTSQINQNCTDRTFNVNQFCSNRTRDYYRQPLNGTCDRLIFCYSENSTMTGVVISDCVPPEPITTTTTTTSQAPITTSTTIILSTTTPLPSTFCSSQPAGLYPYPGSLNCSQYVRCSLVNGVMTQAVFSCAGTTLFDPNARTCVSGYRCVPATTTTTTTQAPTTLTPLDANQYCLTLPQGYYQEVRSPSCTSLVYCTIDVEGFVTGEILVECLATTTVAALNAEDFIDFNAWCSMVRLVGSFPYPGADATCSLYLECSFIGGSFQGVEKSCGISFYDPKLKKCNQNFVCDG